MSINPRNAYGAPTVYLTCAGYLGSPAFRLVSGQNPHPPTTVIAL